MWLGNVTWSLGISGSLSINEDEGIELSRSIGRLNQTFNLMRAAGARSLDKTRVEPKTDKTVGAKEIVFGSPFCKDGWAGISGGGLKPTVLGEGPE